MGTGGDVAGFVDEITTRASDFASVFNIDVSEALQVFQSGLAGEAEPLKRFGINLLQSEVQAYALRSGLISVGETMTEQQKVQARYGLIMEETAKTAGDFANTSDGLANSQRILKANFTDMQATVGKALLPAFAALSTSLIPVVEQLGPVLTGVFEELAPVIGEVAKQIPSLLIGFGPLIPIIADLAMIFLELVQKVLPVFVSLMEMLMPVFDLLMPVLDIVVGLFDLFLIPVSMLIGLLTPLLETILPPLTFAFGLLADALGFMDEVFSPIVESLMPAFNHIVESVAGPIIDHFKSQLTELTDEGFQYLIDAGILPAGTSMQDLSDIAAKQSYRFANLWVKAFNDVITGINGVTRAFITWNNTNLKGLQGFGLFTNLKPLQFEPIPLIPMLSETAFSPSADAIEYGGFGPGVKAPYNAFRMTPMAEGGIVTGPLNALIGEAGPEAVIPLEKMGKMGGNTYNVTINANVADARLGEVVVNAIKRYERSSGPVFASA